MDASFRADRRRDGLALVAAQALLAAVLSVASCGGNDLIFPGDVPATSTSVPTATPTP